MSNNLLKHSLALTLAITLCALQSLAFDIAHFTNESRLASGHWAKIAVSSDGIYQITHEQLAMQGFNPDNVQIYGCGGHAISETLDGAYPDDLQPVPVLRAGNKIIFYAQGTVGMQLNANNYFAPFYTRTFNAYSTQGYYFITDNSGETHNITTAGSQPAGTNSLTTSYAAMLHEQELVSVGHTGKQLLGEDLIGGSVTIPYTLPRLHNDTVMLSIAATANSSSYSYVYGRINHSPAGFKAITFDNDEDKIYAISTKDIRAYHRCAEPLDTVIIDSNSENGQLQIGISTAGTLKRARLDNFIFTYRQLNDFSGIPNAQLRMDYPALTDSDNVAVIGAGENTVVWDITAPNAPVAYGTTQFSDNGEQGQYFTPGARNGVASFVAFDPTQDLPGVSFCGNVDCQNLHGIDTPEMLIVTNEEFFAEAERLADFHRSYDGMDVTVVNQEQVFNEFSSGTPDAMAVRLLCKMLYDRNRNKIKHVLVIGPATYDYRAITTNKPNRVITFVSDNSETEEYSYSTDDFFGILDDFSGVFLANDVLRLGIGRITCNTIEEARSDVDKIIKYVADPDYGAWRNNVTIWADTENQYMHELQADNIANIIKNNAGLALVADKAYVDLFPRAANETDIQENRRTAAEAKRHIKDMLTRGQYYGTFIGHANESTLTYYSHMWTSADVLNFSYTHLPIFTTACCDVARFDSDSKGLAQLMLHKNNGGAIALLAPARQVEANSNDKLNQAFTKNIFNFNSTGRMTTLGEAYRAAKQDAQVRYDVNKMSFLLLGDPAIKVNYPINRVRITKINDQNVLQQSQQVAPMQRITVEAEIINDNYDIDTDFNGDATITLYDVERSLAVNTSTKPTSPVWRNLYYPRDILTQVTAKAVNGVVTTSLLVPRNIVATSGDQLSLVVYAHKTGTDYMVSGRTENITAAEFSEETAVSDNEAPVITAMFINDRQGFEQAKPIGSNAVLYINASDNLAFNTQSMPIGLPMKLSIDGGANYSNITSYASVADEGRTLSIALPLSGLAIGRHNATFQVYDAAGNVAQHSISFIVGPETLSFPISVKDYVAFDQAQIDVEQYASAPDVSAVDVFITDATGQLVRSQRNTSLPFTWDLKDSNSQRVAPGLYRAYATFNNGTAVGATSIVQFVVTSPVLSNLQ